MSPATEHTAKIAGFKVDRITAETTEVKIKADYVEHRVVARAGMCF